MFRTTSALAALALAAVAAGCATPQTSTEPAAAAKTAETAAFKKDSDDYITGSRLPRKNSENTNGTVKASAEEYRRYAPPQGREIQ